MHPLVFSVAEKAGLLSFTRNKARQCPVVLMFHGVSKAANSGALWNAEGKHMTPESFESLLIFLKRYFSPLALSDLIAAWQGEQTLPPRAVVLSFDDGYKNNLTQAEPLLKKHGVPASLYVTTRFLNGEPFWTDLVAAAVSAMPEGPLVFEDHTFELKNEASCLAALKTIKRTLKQKPFAARDAGVSELCAQAGVAKASFFEKFPELAPLRKEDLMRLDRQVWEVGSHTVNHPIAVNETKERWAAELAQAKAELETVMQGSVTLFAYPNGRAEDINADRAQAVKEAGYTCALTTEEGHNSSHQDPFNILRYPVGNNTPMGWVRARISGFHKWLGKT